MHRTLETGLLHVAVKQIALKVTLVVDRIRILECCLWYNAFSETSCVASITTHQHRFIGSHPFTFPFAFFQCERTAVSFLMTAQQPTVCAACLMCIQQNTSRDVQVRTIRSNKTSTLPCTFLQMRAYSFVVSRCADCMRRLITCVASRTHQKRRTDHTIVSE